ncbi:MAG: polyprenol monophosphomannose synthase [Proteobacteria bacterium]|nr:polyprenol monophosphomannose synthase [Pseudomonadota bacterium]MBU1450542.1 polyprenol monophosphomannose synthase [Pseudomonadota bacterium]MBU2470085.1 polyprenol monophosphomannose synthase [Pseudomonadota bacterium]MBU2519227.1 polyprenol monophosphomannose synthase [Pseudomonadota bacterium]
MEVLVVIPTYNEADNLRPLSEALFGLGLDLGILIVDDNSPDGTGKIADELAGENPRFKVIHRPGKQGLGTAYREGFTWALANYDVPLLAQMDADFSHPPERLPNLVQAARGGAVGIGSRYVSGGGVKNWGLGRRFLSKGANVYVSTMLGLPVGDLTGAYKCWPRRALERLDLATLGAGGFAALSEMAYRAHLLGYRHEEFPIIFEDRRVGQSKLTGSIALEAFLNVWRLRFSKTFDPSQAPPA